MGGSIQFLSSILHILFDEDNHDVMNATIHHEIILIDENLISARGRIWQNICRFTNKLT